MNNTHLIIIPGWKGSKQTWQGFVDLAKSKFASIEVIELPCFGDEPCPTEVWGVEEYADFAKEKIEKYKSDTLRHCEEEPAIAGDDVAIHSQLTDVVDCHVARAPRNDVSKFVVLGHSFGGQVLAHLISKNPNTCDGVIFVASSIIRENFLIKRTMLGITAKIGKKIFLSPGLKNLSNLAQKILYKVSDSPDYQKTEGIEREIYKKIIRQDQSGCLDSIFLPTLVVWGDKDRMTPLKYGTMIAKRLKNAKFVVIPGGTHGLHHEKRQELLDGVIRFCKTISTSS